MNARINIQKNKSFGFRCGLILIWSFLLLTANFSFGADVSGGFDSANKLYEEGKFSDAATAYDQLIQSGTVSSTLYFNLGNACFKSGQVGRAIAAYRNAQKISPRDPDVRANLQFVQSRVQGPTLTPNFWQRSLATLTLNEWALLVAFVFWMWLGLWILIQFRPALRQSLSTYLWCGGVTTFVFGGCLGAAWSSNSTSAAIVVTKDATIHNGPLDESTVGATVHDGAELEVLDTKDGWLQVRIDAQRIGWLKREQAVLSSGS